MARGPKTIATKGFCSSAQSPLGDVLIDGLAGVAEFLAEVPDASGLPIEAIAGRLGGVMLNGRPRYSPKPEELAERLSG